MFISGFLFHQVFYDQFEFKRFIIKKTKYVLVPYLILSTIPIVYLLLRISLDDFLSLRTISLQQKEAFSFFSILRSYITGVGYSFTSYWYIPFIMIVFAMSPVFVWFIKLKLKTQILAAFILLICSIFMHRGTESSMFSVFQNVLFFTPIYMLGIISSERKDILYSNFTGKEIYLLSIAITIAVLQAYIGKLGNYHKAAFTLGGIDLMIIQKIILCLFFIVLLNRFENYKLRLLETIAKNSFGIFFTHGIIMMVLDGIKKKIDFSFTSNSFIIYCLVATLVFFLSIITTLLLKKIFPKYSKYLVGT
jgi:surface polysaccharide O-acyltransferase-like enzyme